MFLPLLLVDVIIAIAVVLRQASGRYAARAAKSGAAPGRTRGRMILFSTGGARSGMMDRMHTSSNSHASGGHGHGGHHATSR